VSEGKYYNATTFIKTPRRLIFPTAHPKKILSPALAQKKENANSGLYDLVAN
jgi:hypothetical protein